MSTWARSVAWVSSPACFDFWSAAACCRFEAASLLAAPAALAPPEASFGQERREQAPAPQIGNMATTVSLSLGSNLGDRPDNLCRAIEEMRASGIVVLQVSSFYETEPVDLPDQPWFVNCAVQVRTNLPALELLHVLQAIEQRLGRVRTIPRGPRMIDIDILFHGGLVIDTPELTIPHPRLESRRFVLEPLAEIAPELRHPATGRSIAEMLAAVDDALLVTKVL
jgi:2-amino-4-hydroxy-6-hydroxymethyldihydropteridine diphosphokinase